jgi:hypothetical protein
VPAVKNARTLTVTQRPPPFVLAAHLQRWLTLQFYTTRALQTLRVDVVHKSNGAKILALWGIISMLHV